MQLSSLFATALAVISLGASTASAAIIPRQDGTLKFVKGSPLTFEYQTSQPDAKNWIAIYYSNYGGPVKEEYVTDSLTWEWAKESKGKVSLTTTKLQPGAYTVYFLAKNGYKWLANPIDVIVPGDGPFQFIVPIFTTLNGRVGDEFEADISGLIESPAQREPSFTKVGGDDWIQVSPDGSISGTPTKGGMSFVSVKATSKKNDHATLNVTIPVQNARTPLVEKLTVLTFNMWVGGRKINGFHKKQVRYLANSDADIVGLQESGDGSGIRLAQALGWNVWQGKDVSIITRYPISQVYDGTGVAGAVRVSLDKWKHDVIVWNAHLGYTPYGPYDLCFDNVTVDEVMKRETQSGRTPQIVAIMDKMKPHIANANNVPVILMGDFNAPSHLDWTDATRAQHCNVGPVNWPTSAEPTKAGLVDSFREVHSNPITEPGITWSPIYRTNDGRPEPLDRIDFVYHKGLRTLDSQAQIVGSIKPEPNHADNEWPSDHAAVRSVFRLRFHDQLVWFESDHSPIGAALVGIRHGPWAVSGHEEQMMGARNDK
ncbi:endonuclease/exonuclease/phosphatase family [Purpureocillium lavendulum]|uniref:Endonuclease/exonuclease/phosphatase family n=1 Tax=Purpureocillium lavendulum TaxID=1247861 RepID=A0AB34G1Y5_9HYPO|nr:endonuclease/exonuclease/phosphatase family [Purpureocillium lavendulum]